MKGIQKTLANYLMRFLSIAGICTALSGASFSLSNFWNDESPEFAHNTSFDSQKCGQKLCVTSACDSFYHYGFINNNFINNDHIFNIYEGEKSKLKQMLFFVWGALLRATQIEVMQNLSGDIKELKNSSWIHNWWAIVVPTICGGWFGPYFLKLFQNKSLGMNLFDFLFIGGISLPQYYSKHGFSLPRISLWSVLGFIGKIFKYCGETESYKGNVGRNVSLKQMTGSYFRDTAKQGILWKMGSWIEEFSHPLACGAVIFQDGYMTHPNISKQELLLSVLIPGVCCAADWLLEQFDFVACIHKLEKSEKSLQGQYVLKNSLKNVFLDSLKKVNLKNLNKGFLACREIPSFVNRFLQWSVYPDSIRSSILTLMSLGPLLSERLMFLSSYGVQTWLCFSNIDQALRDQIPQITSGTWTPWSLFEENLARIFVYYFKGCYDFLMENGFTMGEMTKWFGEFKNVLVSYKDTVVSAVQSVTSFFSSSN